MEAATIPVEVHRDKNNFCLEKLKAFNIPIHPLSLSPGSLIYCFHRIQVHSEAKKIKENPQPVPVFTYL